jgi:alginate O-acetyltransferase complex protein AlgJ
MSDAQRTRRIADATVCVAFVVALCAPSFGALLGLNDFDPSLEKRDPAAFPEMRWRDAASIPTAFEAWFSDHFGFRRALVRLSNLARVRLGSSPSPRVIIGRAGWLFYAGEGSIDQFRRARVFTPNEVRAWRNRFEFRRRWLAARGVHYVLMIAPNKEEVYSDLMPNDVRRLERPGQLDQLLGDLRTHTEVTTIDVRQPLRRARSYGKRVYDRTDTHWNGLGEYTVYSAVTASLHKWFPKVEPLQKSAIAETRHPRRGGDLAALVALPDDLPEREAIDVSARESRAKKADPRVTAPADTPPHLIPRAREVDDPSLPRAILIGDSFMTSLVQLFAENFSRTLFLGGRGLDEEVLQQERPDVVIEERIERYLLTDVPETSEDVRRAAVPPQSAWIPPGIDETHAPGSPLPPFAGFRLHQLSSGSDGTLESTGRDPFLASPVPTFEARAAQRVRPCLTISLPGAMSGDRLMAQLFWSTDGSGFSERTSVPFVVLADGLEHCYRVTPSLSPRWRGHIDEIRLDLPDSLPGVRYRLRSMDVTE